MGFTPASPKPRERHAASGCWFGWTLLQLCAWWTLGRLQMTLVLPKPSGHSGGIGRSCGASRSVVCARAAPNRDVGVWNCSAQAELRHSHVSGWVSLGWTVACPHMLLMLQDLSRLLERTALRERLADKESTAGHDALGNGCWWVLPGGSLTP